MKTNSLNLKKHLLATAVLAALVASNATAATVTYTGEDTTTGGEYNNTTVVKPFATTATDVYGTDGYAFFGVQHPGTNNPGGFGNQGSNNPLTFANSGNSNDFSSYVSDPSYLSVTNDTMDSVYGGYGYTQIDIPGAAPSANPGTTQSGLGGIHNSSSTDMLTLSFSHNEADIRLGIIFGEGNPNFTLTQTGGIFTPFLDSDTTDNQLSYGNFDYAFFDLTDVQAGDTFRLDMTSNETNKVIYGLTFDTVPPVITPATPEPSTTALMIAGLAGLVFFGRRRLATHASV